MLTALDREEHRRRGRECGAEEYLTKPFGIDQLLNAVGEVLGRPWADRVRRRQRALESLGAPLKGGVELHFTYDEEFGGELGPAWLLRQGLTRPDLLIAATGEVYGAVVVHYDRDFDTISAITHQSVEWIVPPGSVP